jgi:hypothetical protein
VKLFKVRFKFSKPVSVNEGGKGSVSLQYFKDSLWNTASNIATLNATLFIIIKSNIVSFEKRC